MCIDYTLDDVPTTCATSANMPNCTGTWNPATQTVDTSTPCDFDPGTQLFRDNEVQILLEGG